MTGRLKHALEQWAEERERRMKAEQCIRELEAERDGWQQNAEFYAEERNEMKAENARLREAIKAQPCPHCEPPSPCCMSDEYVPDTNHIMWRDWLPSCWKRTALEGRGDG